MKILVLEDDDSQFDTYSDAVEEFQENNPIEIKLVRAKSVKEAQEKMQENSFDGAIVDLNLDTSDLGEATGNMVLTSIKHDRRFPVSVVSGHLHNLDVEHRENTSALFKTYVRDEVDNITIFKDFFEIYQTGITDILGKRGVVESRLGEIFWNHIADDMDVWIGKDDQQESFLRYTLAHLVESMGHPTGYDDFYHEAEFYIKPPIQEYIATGDIAEKGDDRFVVLSPACDIQARKKNGEIEFNADRIVLGKLIRIERDGFLANGIIAKADNSKTRVSKLSQIINGTNPKYPFLPEYKKLYPAVIDLQNLHSISIEEYLGPDYERLATISSAFLRDIQANLSAYYGRQGQPDLDKKSLCKRYKGKLSPAQS